MRTIQYRSCILKAASFVIVLSLIHVHQPVTAHTIHKRDASCHDDNTDFYCDSEDPGIFHRCLSGIYHTFQCPEGLHFSVKDQACNWPHQADCSFDYGTDYGSDFDDDDSDEGHDSKQISESHRSNTVSEVGHGHSHSHHSGGSTDWSSSLAINSQPSSSWISQAAAAGKSWWRPSGVLSHQIKDLSKIKTPSHVVHIPDEKDEDSKPKKKKKSSTTGTKSKTSTAGGSRKKGAPKSKNTSSWSDSDRKRSSDVQSAAGDCNPSSCHLPSCFCAGTSIPNGIPRSSTPQMVMITFDDEVSPANYGYYQRLFRPGRYNPNGCPIKGCLFVSGSGTVYDLVYPLYAMGMEIASHTVSHRFPHTWWSGASYTDFVEEAAGMRTKLVQESGIPADAIKGFRVPFLQLGADNMYGALYDNKFAYESSMFTGTQFEEGEEPAWPFTLDYNPGPKYCQHGACPNKQYPGMWEIPVQRFYGLDGHSCSMPDGCSSTGDEHETFEYLKSNFRRYYNSNRAPMGIFVHARWFETEHNLDGLDLFIDYLLTLDDVYVVSPTQVIEWMRNPTPLSNIHGLGAWGCEGGADEMWAKKRK